MSNPEPNPPVPRSAFAPHLKPGRQGASGGDAVTLTEINDDPAKYSHVVKLRKVDLEEWKITSTSVNNGKAVEFPYKNFDWPEGYDPLSNPVVPGERYRGELRAVCLDLAD